MELYEAWMTRGTGSNAVRAKRVRELVHTLKQLDPVARDRLLADVAREDPELAVEIRKGIFVFADIGSFDEGEFAALVRRAPAELWALALKTAPGEIASRVLALFPVRARGEMLEAMSVPRKRSEVEAAQAKIADLARGMREGE